MLLVSTLTVDAQRTRLRARAKRTSASLAICMRKFPRLRVRWLRCVDPSCVSPYLAARISVTPSRRIGGLFGTGLPAHAVCSARAAYPRARADDRISTIVSILFSVYSIVYWKKHGQTGRTPEGTRLRISGTLYKKVKTTQYINTTYTTED